MGAKLALLKWVDFFKSMVDDGLGVRDLRTRYTYNGMVVRDV